MAKLKQLGTCELCGREGLETTKHHLTPKELGGTLLPTADLCIACHKQIHALYTNEQLVGQGLTTIVELQREERMASYLRWVRKQPPSRLPRVRKSQQVRGQR
jgi:5-methylcytosine-specific restriction enzyme A